MLWVVDLSCSVETDDVYHFLLSVQYLLGLRYTDYIISQSVRNDHIEH